MVGFFKYLLMATLVLVVSGASLRSEEEGPEVPALYFEDLSQADPRLKFKYPLEWYGVPRRSDFVNSRLGGLSSDYFPALSKKSLLGIELADFVTGNKGGDGGNQMGAGSKAKQKLFKSG